MPDQDAVAKQSVQSRAEDSPFFSSDVVPDAGGFFWLSLARYNDAAPPYDIIYPNARDRWLQNIARQESMMAAAVYAMKTRAQTLDFKISGPEAAKNRAEEMLLNPGLGDNYLSLVGKVIDDFYTSNNGVFIERIAPGDPRKPVGEREILGFAHLDSRLCWRTYDPEFPVIYTNPVTSERHAMHRDRVVMLADNVQPNEMARGVGLCAVDRALQWVRIIRDSTIYREEKVAGKFTRAVGWAEGITKNQLRQALNAVDADQEMHDMVVYNKIPFITAPVNAAGQMGGVKLNMLDLASLPDGFVFKDDLTLYAYVLSFCFGVDAREFWPMTQSGATRADAAIQHLKAQGKGFGLLIRALTWVFRQVLPASVVMEYDFTDDEQDKLVAQLQREKTDTYDIALKAGAINALEMRALMIADGTLDEQILSSLEIPANEITMGSGQDTQATENLREDETADELAQPASVEPSDDDPSTKKKAVDPAVGYRSRVNGLVRALWRGDMNAFEFVDNMNSAIDFWFRRAWYAEIALYGLKPDDMTDAEKNRLQDEINGQLVYLLPFMRAILDNSKANGGALLPLLQRAEMWVNRIAEIRMIAANMAQADQPAEWVVGPTEHCETCLFYEGKVYRRSIWEKYLGPLDLLPRGHGLDCKGYRCQCELANTDKPILSGRPPIWKPSQKAHHHGLEISHHSHHA